MFSRTQKTGLVALVATLGLLVTGCTNSAGVTVTDPWIKATNTSMTAVFATLTNEGSQDVSLVGATAEFAPMLEIHEVVDGVMREKTGGVVIPAGGSISLEPGGDHIMLMGLTSEISAGETVTVEIEFSDGTAEVLDVLVKNYTGANEDYDSGHSDEMEMG